MEDANADDTDADSAAETGDAWADALAEQGASEGEADWGDALAEQAASEAADTTLEKPELDNLEEGSGGDSIEDACLDVILDIPVSISLEVGKTKISIRNLLKLNQGSVVELDRLAGEPLDVLVNGTLIAHAEVVVVNEKYGIRLTDVISAAERIQKLQ
ncbi:MAG: flagellar motor switch protein FliN [Gammaproteobacteria bacterium]|nr:flagellar motor switch protein FliN [Gammaproteobacteria bacterium]